MNTLNCWLFILSVAMTLLGYVQSDYMAIAIGALSAFCIFITHLVTPERINNRAAGRALLASKVWGWTLVLLMLGVVLHQATSGASTEILAKLLEI